MAIGHGQHCVIFDDVETVKELELVTSYSFAKTPSLVIVCIVGSYLDIEGDVRIGDFVSLQSGCYITRGVVIESEVCCGSGIITMNDKTITYHLPSLTFKRQAPRILPAARIGGGSILCPGVTVGENALVGAGSVVTRDVPDRIMVAGNPAVAIGIVPDNEII